MERKVKYIMNLNFTVEEVLRKHRSVNSVANENSIASSNLNRWIRFYVEFGNEGLLPGKTKTTVKFKLYAISKISQYL
jgi:transposase